VFATKYALLISVGIVLSFLSSAAIGGVNVFSERGEEIIRMNQQYFRPRLTETKTFQKSGRYAG
jgi:hypothetical protein